MDTSAFVLEMLEPSRVEGMLASRFPGVRVQGVHIEELGEGTNANARLRLEYERPSGAPEYVFAKLPPLERQRRHLVLSSGMGGREVLFYRHLASSVPIRVPQVYGTWLDEAGLNFSLLIEDLQTSGCNFPDGERGVGRKLAERAMLDFAALHSAGRPEAELDLSHVKPPLRQPEYGAAMLEHALATRSERLSSSFAAIARIYVDQGEAVHDLWESGASGSDAWRWACHESL